MKARRTRRKLWGPGSHTRPPDHGPSTVLYYYAHGLVDGKRREEPLGSDYGLAIKRWAEIEHASAEKPAAVVTFRYTADRYRAEVIPTKAAATQKDNARELKQLIAFFDDPPCPFEAIEPQHVKQYLKWRGTLAKVRANREKVLLSHIWNWARGEGYTTLPNPCAGIKGFRETGRDVYVEDDTYSAVWKLAGEPLRDAMDLAYLTGQRVADTLKMDERDVRDGFLQSPRERQGPSAGSRSPGPWQSFWGALPSGRPATRCTRRAWWWLRTASPSRTACCRALLPCARGGRHRAEGIPVPGSARQSRYG